MPIDLPRRTLLAGAAGAAAMIAGGPALAALAQTPSATAGPYYPRTLPADSDADLVHLAGRGRPAAGTAIEVTGRVLDRQGRPLPGAVVELWQANAAGRYSHPGDDSDAPIDPNFQGFGQVRADETGQYRFLTVKPGAYGGFWFRRTPHLHFRIVPAGGGELITQMYFAGEPENEKDSLLNRIRDQEQRAGVIVRFAPAAAGSAAEIVGRFDIVLG